MINLLQFFLFYLICFLTSTVFGLPKCNGDYKLECHGVILHKNGEKYVGEIKDYKYNGKGTYLYINGNIYTGDFKDGILQGKGVFEFSNGDKYEG